MIRYQLNLTYSRLTTEQILVNAAEITCVISRSGGRNKCAYRNEYNIHSKISEWTASLLFKLNPLKIKWLLQFVIITCFIYKYHNCTNNKRFQCVRINTGRFIMFSVITKIYNKKTKGPTLMELFTATEKLKKIFLTTRDVLCAVSPVVHTSKISSCQKNPFRFSCGCKQFH
jgi:hypothetical protein